MSRFWSESKQGEVTLLRNLQVSEHRVFKQKCQDLQCNYSLAIALGECFAANVRLCMHISSRLGICITHP